LSLKKVKLTKTVNDVFGQ